jgi:predicted regulator of Ras-like GTPase activity (Roadblock/LC7/MglB family)
MVTELTMDLKAILNDLTRKPGMIAALVVSRDGFIIDGTSGEDVDLEALAAVTSSAFIAWESAGIEVAIGQPRVLLVETENGSLVVTPVDADALLVVMGNRLANLGRIRIEAARARESVGRCL